MQDGRDSFLGKLNKMEKLGGLSPKEKISEEKNLKRIFKNYLCS